MSSMTELVPACKDTVDDSLIVDYFINVTVDLLALLMCHSLVLIHSDKLRTFQRVLNEKVRPTRFTECKLCKQVTIQYYNIYFLVKLFNNYTNFEN